MKTYSGITTLASGRLAFGSTNAIGTNTPAITGGNLDNSVANLVNGGNNPLFLAGSFAHSGSDPLNLGSGRVTLTKPPTITVTNSGATRNVAGPFQPNWPSRAQDCRCPEWFRDAKFGIWAHWSAPCVRFGAQDIRFTTKGDTLYAYFLGWPEDGKLAIQLLASGATEKPIPSLKLLGSPEIIGWKQDDGGLHVTLPATKPGNGAFALKLA